MARFIAMEDSDTPLKRFCMEAAELSNIQTPKAVNQFHDDVEKLLTTLDEYCNLVDLVRGDTSHILTQALPQLHDKVVLLRTVFEKIDCLEAFLQDMRRNVEVMEAAVDAAEGDLGTLTTLKKSLFSKFSTKQMLTSHPSEAQPSSGPPTFTPPAITPLSKWMPSIGESMSDEVQASASSSK